MAFQLSPGVNFSEIDLTNATSGVATTEGALAGVFRWGPINERTLITSENQLVDVFGAPSSRYTDVTQTQLWSNAETFYTAANFLGYSDALYVTRVVETQEAGEIAVIAENSDSTIQAKYFGELGNSIEVSFCKGTAAGLEGFNGKQYSDGSAGIVPTIGGTSAKLTGLETHTDALDIDAGDKIEIIDSATDEVIQTMTVSADVTVGAESTASQSIVALPLQTIATIDELDNTDAGVFINASGAGLVDNGGLKRFFSIAHTAVDTTNNDITFPAPAGESHGFEPGDEISFATSGTAPSLTAGGTLSFSTYFVLEGSAVNKMRLSLTEGGDAIEFSAQGSGNFVFTEVADADETALNEIKRSSIIILGQDLDIFPGAPVEFTGASAALPTGIVSGQTYYAIPVDSESNDLGEVLPFVDADSDGIADAGVTTNAIKLAATYEDATSHTTAVPKAIYLTAGATAATTAQIDINDPTQATVNFTSKYTGIKTTGLEFKKYWGGTDLFDSAPSSASRIHVAVKDKDGAISGTPGTVLETYANASLTAGTKAEDGTSNFLPEILEAASKWIKLTNGNATSIRDDNAKDYDNGEQFGGGDDGRPEDTISLGDVAAGYDLYKDASDVDVSFILQGKPRGGTTLSNYIIDNIADVRRDCVAFVSPEKGDNTAQKIVNFASTLTASTYAVVDSGYKYQYDKFSDVYRWIPLNGDIAGLCARTDDLRDPWFSPAGYSRGNVKNVVKLNFNPNKSQRDLLYKNGINPVITQPGQGTVLFGDKTYAPTTSAFDRINVRRLFIVLEKTISRAAKSSLFEFNDEFTRAQFVNLVEPFLRDVQGRRGIYDFKVICDESNNTGQVIDTNSFVGDIYIKPARSINFIQLNFVAVRSGVEFSEVVGAA
ncbi:phage tail sheath subtilisin-like domain-containing protein [bacterium]|nr:phage tail sheath subtilisin-like domain-containing protein [bacterium]